MVSRARRIRRHLTTEKLRQSTSQCEHAPAGTRSSLISPCRPHSSRPQPGSGVALTHPLDPARRKPPRAMPRNAAQPPPSNPTTAATRQARRAGRARAVTVRSNLPLQTACASPAWPAFCAETRERTTRTSHSVHCPASAAARRIQLAVNVQPRAP
jgi:hypothetical protein